MQQYQKAIAAAEHYLEELSDEEYIEACDEIAEWFKSAAETKQAELERET